MIWRYILVCVTVFHAARALEDRGPIISRWRPDTRGQGNQPIPLEKSQEDNTVNGFENLPDELHEALTQRYSPETLELLKEMREESEWANHEDDDITNLSDLGDGGGNGAARKPKKTFITEEQMRWWRTLGGGTNDSGRAKRSWWNEVMLRREYRTLSRKERKAYHRALHAMKQTMVGNLSQYDMFVQFHQQEWSPSAHFGASFLPWHREFLFRFELILQTHSYNTAIPYWDSRLDRHLPNPRDSIIFSDEFMGDPDGLVETGQFKYWPVIERCRIGNNKTVIRNDFEMPAEALFQDSDVEYVTGKTSFRDVSIPAIFEWEHGGPHIFVGGQMGNITCSPSDPIFWSHHTFIDSVWQKFRDEGQTTDKQEEYPEHANLTSDIGGVNHNPLAPMLPFEPLVNKDGLMTFYTDFYYNYAPHPVWCKKNEDCGLYLWCNNGRCMSKVKLWGNCTGLAEDKPDPCECGVCSEGICSILKASQWGGCWK